MTELNQQLFILLYGMFGKGTYFADVSIFLSRWLIFLLISCSVAYELYAREGLRFVRAVVRVMLPSGTAYVIAKVIKVALHLPRPYAVLDFVTPLVPASDAFGSFPSSHATLAAALGVTMYTCNRKFGRWYLLGAVLVAIGRVTTGVHWPVDVLAGLILGASVAFVVELFLRKFFPKLSAEC